MRLGRSFFRLTLFSFMFLSPLVLGISESGLAQSPHPCKADLSAHQPSTLGGVSSFKWTFSKTCTLPSNATTWTIYIYNYSNWTQPICGSPFVNPSSPFTVTCPVTQGSGYQARIFISFERAGSPMNHAENFYNP